MKRVVSSILQELHEVLARLRSGGVAWNAIDFLDDVNNAILELSRIALARIREKWEGCRARAIVLAATYSQNQVVPELVQSSKFASKKISKACGRDSNYLIRKEIFFSPKIVISALSRRQMRFPSFWAASPQSYPQPCGFLRNSYMKRVLSCFPQELH